MSPVSARRNCVCLDREKTIVISIKLSAPDALRRSAGASRAGSAPLNYAVHGSDVTAIRLAKLFLRGVEAAKREPILDTKTISRYGAKIARAIFFDVEGVERIARGGAVLT